MLASHVISHVIDYVTVRIFVVVYSWVDPINTLCSSARHDCQHHHRDLASLQGCLSITKGFMVLIGIVIVLRIQDVIGVLSHHPRR